VAGVDSVADRLADQMIADRVELEVVRGEQLTSGKRVGSIAAIDLHVITPAGEFHAVIAEVPGQGAEIGQRQVGPLAGE
jgi:hypothetical protein